MILIRPAENGATVNYYGEGYSIECGEVYKFDYEDLEGLSSLLYDVAFNLGFNRSRYDKQRINVEIAHGDKFDNYACVDCTICRNSEELNPTRKQTKKRKKEGLKYAKSVR